MHGCGVKRSMQESGQVKVEAGLFQDDLFVGPSVGCDEAAVQESEQAAAKAARQARGLLVRISVTSLSLLRHKAVWTHELASACYRDCLLNDPTFPCWDAFSSMCVLACEALGPICLHSACKAGMSRQLLWVHVLMGNSH